MTTVRRALQETKKIGLGARFSFELDVSDWEGWPRIELALWDSLAESPTGHALTVSADDLGGNGSIKVAFNRERLLGHVQLKDPAEFQRLPMVLKKAVREFLDYVSQYVLNPKKPDELLSHQTKAIETEDPDALSSKLKDADMFNDAEVTAGQDNRVDVQDDELAPVEI